MEPTTRRMMMTAGGAPKVSSVTNYTWSYDSSNPASLSVAGSFLIGDVVVVLEVRENNSDVTAPTLTYISGYTSITGDSISTYSGSGLYAMSYAFQYRRLTSNSSGLTVTGAMTGTRNGLLFAAVFRGNVPIATVTLSADPKSYWTYGSTSSYFGAIASGSGTPPLIDFSIYIHGSDAFNVARADGQAFSTDGTTAGFTPSTFDADIPWNLNYQVSWMSYDTSPINLWGYLPGGNPGVRALIFCYLSFT